MDYPRGLRSLRPGFESQHGRPTFLAWGFFYRGGNYPLPMPRRPKRLDHRPLLGNPLVKTWYDATALRSARTADVNLRQLGLCLHEIGLAPREFVDEARKDPARLRGRLVDYATRMQARGLLGTYIAKTFSGAGSFLRHHDAEFRGFPRVQMVRGESIENERPPTQEELARLLRALPVRGQVSALLMAHAGLRPGTFATYRAADDALRLRDLPELDLERTQFRKIPFLIRVPGSLSKTRKAYVTFGTSELADSLLAYLRERRSRPRWSRGEQGDPEVLTPDSPVVAIRDTETETGFVTVKAVTVELRNGIRRVVPADTTWRPYVLRSYASTQLLLAESKGLIIRDVREEILGHDLGVGGRYNLSKKLGPSVVEELRAAYGRATPFLLSGQARGEQQGVDVETRRLLLEFVGYSKDQVAEMDPGALEGDDLLDRLRKGPKWAGSGATGPAQRVVPQAEVPALLEAGWLSKGPFGDGNWIVERQG